MIDRLTQAKAAAIQWVTYTGEPETLPDSEMPILVNGRTDILYRVEDEDCYWCIEQRHTGYEPTWRINIGDRWAYLPQPPASEG